MAFLGCVLRLGSPVELAATSSMADPSRGRITLPLFATKQSLVAGGGEEADASPDNPPKLLV